MLRSIVLVTSVFALGFSTSIHHLSNNYRYGQNPSTTMAVIVDVVAIPYISYITYDEYRGKPLGLRPAKTKIRLVLLDLFFIIFESANLALAFGALTDNNGACTQSDLNPPNSNVCDRVKTLCAILFVALVAWSATFAISIFRYDFCPSLPSDNVAANSKQVSRTYRRPRRSRLDQKTCS